MHGDFSRWPDEPRDAAGVLFQHGRPILDADLNARALLRLRWQRAAGRAAFGSGVAAVPADDPDAFRVLAAATTGDGIRLTLRPGRAWADGLLASLPPGPGGSVERIATYLGDAPDAAGADGTRDAVIAEVWPEALNGFQSPDELVEPALGGPDTAERIRHAVRLRLVRMAEDESCDDVADRVRDELDERGRLTASLEPPSETSEECPVVETGGYSGLEHNLYRIEIAERASGETEPMFKWSQFNGGLVGLGAFDAADDRLAITANRPAILRSGLDEFYLEALEPDADVGGWRLVYGAHVTLGSDGDIELPASAVVGSVPGDGLPRFFRLWNGRRPISEFAGAGAPNELNDGINLEFTSPLSGEFRAGDYWTFAVRAGEIGNPLTLVDDEPPAGVLYARVPLAVLDWAAASSIAAEDGEIEDCRRPFQPLTRLSTCCTYRVGDGVHSHGDFDSIQEAVDRLPEEGGEICVLPGVYRENVVIEERHHVTIHGCGRRSRIVSTEPSDDVAAADPVIHVRDSRDIRLESLGVEAHASGIGVLIDESDADGGDDGGTPAVAGIHLSHLTARAAARSAIEIRGGRGIELHDNRVIMQDARGDWPAVTIRAEDVRVEDNRIAVAPSVDDTMTRAPGPPIVRAGLGGLWLRGGCAAVRVIDNDIAGGMGNGITLGDVVYEEDEAGRGPVGWIFTDPEDPCGNSGPGKGWIPPAQDDEPTPVAGPPLRDIVIARNRIGAMGLNGIGVYTFFETDEQGLISVEGLRIDDNDIVGCLRRTLAPVPDAMDGSMGFGGIALADVEALVVRDNRIGDNGRDWLDPVCGVYVLHGEGIEIDRNRVVNNGARTENSPDAARRGARGGIVVQLAMTPTVSATGYGTDAKLADTAAVAPEDGRRAVPGVPAARIHDNVVSAPLGRALTLNALGAVSVQGNHLASHAIAPGAMSLLASTVLILDLGASFEFLRARKDIAAFYRGSAMAGPAAYEAGDFSAAAPINIAAGDAADRELVAMIRSSLFGGNVLFADNQCLLNLLDPATDMAISSVLVISLDDVGFHDNQSDCALATDFVIMNTMLLANTLRTNGNRWKETIGRSFASAVTAGFLNDTSHNQGTHCILARKIDRGTVTGELVAQGNMQVIDRFAGRNYCEALAKVLFTNVGG